MFACFFRVLVLVSVHVLCIVLYCALGRHPAAYAGYYTLPVFKDCGVFCDTPEIINHPGTKSYQVSSFTNIFNLFEKKEEVRTKVYPAHIKAAPNTASRSTATSSQAYMPVEELHLTTLPLHTINHELTFNRDRNAAANDPPVDPTNGVFVYVSTLPNAGYGLFAGLEAPPIEAGDHITHYGGELLSREQFWEQYPDGTGRYVVWGGNGGWGRDGINERRSTHLGRYANTNRKRNNATLVVDHRTRTIRLKATRKIHTGHEIFLAYGIGNHVAALGDSGPSMHPSHVERYNTVPSVCINIL